MKDIERKIVLDMRAKQQVKKYLGGDTPSVMEKGYLETEFPDGTPVKIYPVKEQIASIEAGAIETMIALADKSPVIEHGAVNAVYYKDLIVLSGQYSDTIVNDLKVAYPQIKHVITISNKSFERRNDKSIQQSVLSSSNQMD